MQSDEVLVRTPSTIGNFGPGFDVTSLALAWGGDTIRAKRSDPDAQDEVVLEGEREGIPGSWDENAAALAFDQVRKRLGEKGPVRLTVEKGVKAGSGLGSSASSAGGGVLAALALYRPEPRWSASMMLEAALGAEAKVAGRHGDDLAAVILGGLAIVREGAVKRWDPPQGLAVAVVRPELSLPTRKMRSVLPESVPRGDAVMNLGSLALLLKAWQEGDVKGVQGALEDRLAAPYRRRMLPFFDAVREAALGEGASGVAISGSGPSLFTVADGLDEAKRISGAMAQAVRETDVEAQAIACWPESRHVWREALD